MDVPSVARAEAQANVPAPVAPIVGRRGYYSLNDFARRDLGLAKSVADKIDFSAQGADATFDPAQVRSVLSGGDLLAFNVVCADMGKVMAAQQQAQADAFQAKQEKAIEHGVNVSMAKLGGIVASAGLLVAAALYATGFSDAAYVPTALIPTCLGILGCLPLIGENAPSKS